VFTATQWLTQTAPGPRWDVEDRFASKKFDQRYGQSITFTWGASSFGLAANGRAV
jgi:hypothetical protein